MPASGFALLQRLEPAVRPAGAPADPFRHPTHALETVSFASLLEQAHRGAIASGRLPSASELAEPLLEGAAPRIGHALDLLEAHGSRRAIVLYGSRMFVADVATRTIESELLAHEGPMPERVDCAVRVPTPEEERPTSIPGPPNAVSAPPGVVELLEARDSHW